MPCSYCSFVGASPTFAKWPFIVITEGAVGNLEAVEGLLVPWPFVLEEVIVRKRDSVIQIIKWLGNLSCDVVWCASPCPSVVNWHLIQSCRNHGEAGEGIWTGG